MKAPIHYYGGKTYQAAWILGVLERYSFKTYIEPFGGSGAILFAKEPSRIEIYNDIYSDLVTLYKVLRRPRMFKEFMRFIENSPYTRELFSESKAALTKENLSMVERAGHFFILIRQSFSSLRSTWSSAGKGIKPKAKPYQTAIEHLSEVHVQTKTNGCVSYGVSAGIEDTLDLAQQKGKWSELFRSCAPWLYGGYHNLIKGRPGTGGCSMSGMMRFIAQYGILPYDTQPKIYAGQIDRLEDVKTQINSNYFDCFVILDIERTKEKPNYELSVVCNLHFSTCRLQVLSL